MSLYHRFPLGELDVNITFPPEQNVGELNAVTVGAIGVGFTVTIIPFDGIDSHPFIVTLAVYAPLVVALNVVAVDPLIAIPSLYH
jgi:hypothetical protein